MGTLKSARAHDRRAQLAAPLGTRHTSALSRDAAATRWQRPGSYKTALERCRSHQERTSHPISAIYRRKQCSIDLPHTAASRRNQQPCRTRTTSSST